MWILLEIDKTEYSQRLDKYKITENLNIIKNSFKFKLTTNYFPLPWMLKISKKKD